MNNNLSAPLGSKMHYLLSILMLLLNIPIQYGFGWVSYLFLWWGGTLLERGGFQFPDSNPNLLKIVLWTVGYLITLLILFLVTFIAYRLLRSGDLSRDKSSIMQTVLRYLSIIVGVIILIFYLIYHTGLLIITIPDILANH